MDTSLSVDITGGCNTITFFWCECMGSPVNILFAKIVNKLVRNFQLGVGTIVVVLYNMYILIVLHQKWELLLDKKPLTKHLWIHF